MKTRPDLLRLVADAISAGFAVYAPVKQEDRVMLARVESADPVDFEHVLTVNGLKDVLLPRCETLASFDRERQSVQPVRDNRDKILIFGTRPCDAAGLEILDSILLGSVRDARYAERREGTVIVTLACCEADEACFCTSMGYGPHDATGSDLLVLPSGDGYVTRALTAKGRQFLEEMGVKEDVGDEPDDPPELRRTIDTADLKEWLDANFDSPRWRRVSENCVSCGTCYYLCPTCHCFDITDEAGISRGERMRIWDCCSFSGFTRMATHQPRVGRHARYRQRIMHKFKYCVDNTNRAACVGDGRCVRHCPYGVDICEILEALPREGQKD